MHFNYILFLRPKSSATLNNLCRLLALLLAAIGVYGTMAYTVSQRTREIGVRMALGAQRSTVLRLFLRDGFKLAILGVVVGLALSFAAMRAMASLLFNVKPTDAVAFASAALLLRFAVFLANYIPARRAHKD